MKTGLPRSVEHAQSASSPGSESRQADHPSAPRRQLPRVLTVEEAAAALAVNRKTLYLQIQRGHVPGVRRVGRSYRISADVLFAWLEKGRG